MCHGSRCFAGGTDCAQLKRLGAPEGVRRGPENAREEHARQRGGKPGLKGHWQDLGFLVLAAGAE